MGEAKRRGTKEQRIAQSIERQRIEDAKRSEEFRQREAERIKRMSAQERKEAVLIAGPGPAPRITRHMLAVAMAAADPVLIVDPARRVDSRVDNQGVKK